MGTIFRRSGIVVSLLAALALIAFDFLQADGNTIAPLAGLVAAILVVLEVLISAATNYIDRHGRLDIEQPKPKRHVGTPEQYLDAKMREFDEEMQLYVETPATIRAGAGFAEDQPLARFADAMHLGAALPGQPEHAVSKPRFVLVGEPGAGKSTALRKLFVMQAERYLNGEDSRLPLWISLSRSRNPEKAEDLLEHWWHNEAFLPDSPMLYMKHNRLMLFLDGLNEMPEDSRRARYLSLRDFVEGNPRVPMIISCRHRDYYEDFKFQLPVLQVERLDAKRIRQFIELRLGRLDLWRTILRRYKIGDDALASMARNPYTLAMLTRIFRERRLPSDVNELYREYLSVRYDYERSCGRVKLKWETLLERRLKKLAFRMVSEGKSTSVEDIKWAQRILGRRAIKECIDLGILVPEDHVLRFYHQTLQGYFALDNLIAEMRKGSTHRRAKFIGQIADLERAGKPAVPALLIAAEDDDITVRAEAILALGRIQDIRGLNTLINALINDDDWVYEAASKALADFGKPAVDPLVAILTGRDDPDIQLRVVSTLSRLGEVDLLIKLLQRETGRTQARVAWALERVATREAKYAVAQYKKGRYDYLGGFVH